MSTRNRIVITGKLLMHSERIDHIPFTLKERSKSTMQVLYRICCGLDVHVKTVVACLLKATGERIVRTFGTMTDDLLQLADWLKANGCTHVAMESTGVYWKPVFNILEGSFSVILANPYHIKAVPGRKTDVKDCEWIADLLLHGLIQASFIPPLEIRELRELTRYRMTKTDERARLANRIQKVAECANIKLGQVASDALGKSGYAMLRALADGVTDAEKMAQLARSRLRSKKSELVRALTGHLTPAQRWLLGELLDQYAACEAAIERVNKRIDEEVKDCRDPFVPEAVELSKTAFGVGHHTAQDIIAEIGVDMTCFYSASHLASWAGVCPGNNESAGKRKHGKTTFGNRYLKRALCQVAWAAVHSKGSYLRTRYRRLASRRGTKRALLAICHSILVSLYHMLAKKEPYRDLGADYFQHHDKDRLTRKYIRKLEALGLRVTIEQVPKAA